MGKRNRERRRAKQQQQRRSRPSGSPPGGRHRGGSEHRIGDEAAEAVVMSAAHAFGSGQEATYERLLAALVDEGSQGHVARQVDAVLARCLERAVGEAWQRGWQPADLVQVVGRRLAAAHERVAVEAVAAEARRYARTTLHPRWIAQLVALGADSEAAPPDGGPSAADHAERVRHSLETLSVLLFLPPLPRLCPLPGEAPFGEHAGGMRSAGPGRADPRMLERVRALLAKAESTSFPEEAEALTAKAQELMARHAIDRALLDAATGDGASPVGRRLPIDDPYAGAKSLLLSEVAQANRCRSVWSKELGFSTVFGHEADVDSVELLFTSLLVQATAAMTAAGRSVDRWGRSRTRSFRQSFLVAYATRIGARLREAAAAGAAAAEEEHGASLLPVLAAQDEAVEEACVAAFPELSQRSMAATNASGWYAGLAAAEVASLDARPQVAGPSPGTGATVS